MANAADTLDDARAALRVSSVRVTKRTSYGYVEESMVAVDDAVKVIAELLSAAPTDEDREALHAIVHYTNDQTAEYPRDEDFERVLTDRILTAGFRRQVPITDAQVEAAAHSIYVAIVGGPITRGEAADRYADVARTALEAARAVA